MQKIIVEGIRIYAYHGCLDEEAKIGSDYIIELQVTADLTKSANSDELKDTLDYVHLYNIAKQEMDIRAKLLETVAQRIKLRIHSEFPQVSDSIVKISKVNPPIGGDVQTVTVQF